MIVIDERLLEEFRRKTRCEYCGRQLRHAAEPHHYRAKGMGGGSRLDVCENLIALGGPWDCGCHRLTHDGKILRSELLAKIAAREGLTAAECRQRLDDMLAKKKERR